jgi:hypothetical protein
MILHYGYIVLNYLKSIDVSKSRSILRSLIDGSLSLFFAWDNGEFNAEKVR